MLRFFLYLFRANLVNVLRRGTSQVTESHVAQVSGQIVDELLVARDLGLHGSRQFRIECFEFFVD